MLAGRSTNRIDESGEITGVSSSSTPKEQVTNQEIINEVESFILENSKGWDKSWHTSVAPEKYMIIHLSNDVVYSLGYSSDLMIKYSENFYRQQHVDESVINQLKELINRLEE